MALRDILVRWRMQVDNTGIKQAEKSINSLNTSIDRTAKTFLGLYGIGRVAGGFMDLIQGASDAVETMNVLNQTFKANSNEVVSWSKTVGKTMGRSQYELQKTAGQFGSFLAPQGFAGNELAAMSEQLTALSVDLASFYNISDSEAQVKLFSGLAGETEAVRRLGIDLSEQGLQAFGDANGTLKGRKFSKISMQEKTQMRLNKILKDTIDKQGDAIRTYNEWENTWKRFQGEVKDMSVEFGKRLIPIAKSVVKELESWLPVLTRIGSESRIVESGLEALGFAATSLAVAYAAQNLAMAGGIVALGGLFLLFDEIRTGLSDGPSDTVIGDFAENILGIDDPWKKFAEGLQEVVGTLDVFTAGLMDLALFIPRLPEFIIRTLRGEDVPLDFLASNTRAAMERAAQNDAVQTAADRSREDARIRAAGGGDIDAFRATYAGEQITSEQLHSDFLKYRQGDIQRRVLGGEMLIPTAQDAAEGLSPGHWGYSSNSGGLNAISAGQPTTPGQERGDLSTQTVININGGNIQEVRKTVEDVMDARNRRLQAAMSRTAYTGTDAAF